MSNIEKGFISESTGRFAELLAAGTPTPGGGSAAAYAGVLATSLGQMMCNITLGKSKYAHAEPRVREIASNLKDHGKRLWELIEEDATGFEAVIEAYHRPHTTDEEKQERHEKIEEASLSACRAPLEIAEIGLEVLKLLDELADIGNPSAMTDITIGGGLAEVAVKGSFYNIGVNLELLPSNDETNELRRRITNLLEEADDYASEIETDLFTRVKY